MSPRLVLATRNAHKVGELRSLLADTLGLPTDVLDEAVVGLDASAPEVQETGITFEQNALLKARSAAAHTGLPALADDSGICVDVLGGSPGIFSALWCGEHGADQRSTALLLAQLVDVPSQHRGAAFVAVVALVHPGGQERTERGELRGTVARTPAGAGGFGYDPVFVPDGATTTLAEHTPEQKNAVSHRSRGLRAMAPHLGALLG